MLFLFLSFPAAFSLVTDSLPRKWTEYKHDFIEPVAKELSPLVKKSAFEKAVVEPFLTSVRKRKEAKTIGFWNAVSKENKERHERMMQKDHYESLSIPLESISEWKKMGWMEYQRGYIDKPTTTSWGNYVVQNIPISKKETGKAPPPSIITDEKEKSADSFWKYMVEDTKSNLKSIPTSTTNVVPKNMKYLDYVDSLSGLKRRGSWLDYKNEFDDFMSGKKDESAMMGEKNSWKNYKLDNIDGFIKADSVSGEIEALRHKAAAFKELFLKELEKRVAAEEVLLELRSSKPKSEEREEQEIYYGSWSVDQELSELDRKASKLRDVVKEAVPEMHFGSGEVLDNNVFLPP